VAAVAVAAAMVDLHRAMEDLKVVQVVQVQAAMEDLRRAMGGRLKGMVDLRQEPMDLWAARAAQTLGTRPMEDLRRAMEDLRRATAGRLKGTEGHLLRAMAAHLLAMVGLSLATAGLHLAMVAHHLQQVARSCPQAGSSTTTQPLALRTTATEPPARPHGRRPPEHLQLHRLQALAPAQEAQALRCPQAGSKRQTLPVAGPTSSTGRPGRRNGSRQLSRTTYAVSSGSMRSLCIR